MLFLQLLVRFYQREYQHFMSESESIVTSQRLPFCSKYRELTLKNQQPTPLPQTLLLRKSNECLHLSERESGTTCQSPKDLLTTIFAVYTMIVQSTETTFYNARCCKVHAVQYHFCLEELTLSLRTRQNKLP